MSKTYRAKKRFFEDDYDHDFDRRSKKQKKKEARRRKDAEILRLSEIDDE